MIFAVLDPSPLTVCINCSFFTFIYLSILESVCPYVAVWVWVWRKGSGRKEEKERWEWKEEAESAARYAAANQVIVIITGAHLRLECKKSIGICCRRQSHVCVLFVRRHNSTRHTWCHCQSDVEHDASAVP